MLWLFEFKSEENNGSGYASQITQLLCHKVFSCGYQIFASIYLEFKDLFGIQSS